MPSARTAFLGGIVIALLAILMIIPFSLGEDKDSSSAQLCVQEERTDLDFSILNDVRLILAEHSVFQDTAQDPGLLLNSALESIFGYLGVPNTQIPSWAHALVDEELAKSSNAPDFSVLNNVYTRLIQDDQYGDLQETSRLEELIDTTVRGIIDALGDPFASYVPRELWRSNASQTIGRYRGMGVTVRTNDQGEISIGSVFEGSPAEDSGIDPDDAILAVNRLSTQDCTVGQFILAVKTLGVDTLNLTIARQSSTSTQRDVYEDVEVALGQIQQISLSTYPGIDLPGNRGSSEKDIPYRCDGSGFVGLPCPFADEDGDGTVDILYIKISSFTDQMASDLNYALSTMDTSKFKGVIVDVRNNGGGLVTSIVDTVDFFLPTRDIIYSTRNAAGVVNRVRSNRVTYIDEEIPIVILVNKDSYSGAELFPAALRDNGRAIIVSRDERTGGKGSVNRHYELRHGEYGALYVSVELWITPSGEEIEAMDLDGDGHYEIGGLSPDILVDWSDSDIRKNDRDVNYDPTLQAALQYIEDSLK